MKQPRYLPPPPLSAKGSVWLDVLKLFFVAQVFGGHLAGIAFPTFPELDFDRAADVFVGIWRLTTRFGQQGAYVFVCISGYFLVDRLLAAGLRDPQARPIGGFLASRLRRIYPTLVAALALTLACDLVGLRWLGAEAFYRTVAGYDGVAALSWASGIGNLLSLQPTFSDAFGTNGPLWTLGYIVQFYVVGAALAALLRFRPPLAAWGLGLLLLAALVWRVEWALLFCCWLGCSLMRWVRPVSGGGGAMLLVVGMALFVLANLLPVELSIVVSGIAGCLLVLAATSRLGEGRGWSKPGWLVGLSAASYPFYAFHYPVAVVLFAAAAPHVDVSALWFRAGWPLVVLVVVLLLSLAWQAGLDRLQK